MSLWGPLAERYETPRPRRLLALDGGGIRGVMTLEVLAEIERQLRALRGAGDDFRLCDFFDYVGGTSTGAIIAAGLARGMSAAELLTFYKTVGPSMFDKEALLRRYRNLYKSEPLAAQLKVTFGTDSTLEPRYLRCLLLAVTRNVSTDSPWPISSNPLARYNDPERADCNLRIPLWKLVRASTAAPIFFPPEVIEWDPDDPAKSFVFVDGGMTPYNNPAFLLYRMATLPEYRLGWAQGERDLMLVSLGTGGAAVLGVDASDPAQNLLSNAASIPGALMNGAQIDQDVNCRTVGRCVAGEPIDRELGDMIPRSDGRPIPLAEDLGRSFLYARYNADLSREGLDALGLPDVDPKQVKRLDSVEFLGELARVGQAVARQVRMEDFGTLITA
jgi:Patatin-like phospholipase